MRAVAEVRRAGAEDLENIALLCVEARQESPSGSQVCGTDLERLKRQLSVVDAVPGSHLLAAHHEDALVGFIVVRALEPHLFSVEPVLYIEALYVGVRSRRHGVGHALLAAVADLAEKAGAQDVYSIPAPGSRGVQRFLARLGFAPIAGHRWVATTTLQRRLAEQVGGGRRRGRSVEHLIARRRRARGVEGPSGVVDLRDFQARHRASAGETLAR